MILSDTIKINLSIGKANQCKIGETKFKVLPRKSGYYGCNQTLDTILEYRIGLYLRKPEAESIRI